jgi:tetratricopeptide (TPR) repeat protein
MLAVSRQEFAKAAEAATRLTAENPRMVDAWDLLGLSLARLGRLRESREAYRKAMELTGGTSHLAASLGNIELELGNLDEAERYFELTLEASPAIGHSNLATVARQRKDYAKAEREARAALDAGGSRVAALLLLAEIRRDQGALDEALGLTDQAVQATAGENVQHSGLYLLRGDLLSRLERVPEAVQAFNTEIQQFPADPRAYSRLAALLVASGHGEEAGQVLRALIGRNPDSPSAFAEAVRSLRVLGDPQTAAQLLARARQRFPNDETLAGL